MENTLKIYIDCDNSAFGSGNDWRHEAARILRGLASRIESGDSPFLLRDANGNNVGGVLYNELA
jgi:hypothetical protein